MNTAEQYDPDDDSAGNPGSSQILRKSDPDINSALDNSKRKSSVSFLG